MPTPSNHPTNVENPGQGTRLDSWKEIAAYLCRGERTVKRWETDRGLPIHRLPGGGRASVYAYTAELDEWLKSSEVREVAATEDDGEGEETAIPFREVSIAGDGPLPGNRSSPNTSAVSSGPNRKWLFAFTAALVAALTGAALQLVALRSGNLRLSQQVVSLFSKSPPISLPAGSRVVSDQERDRARDLYLKGRYEWNQRTPDSLNRALDDFTQAVVHNPEDAKSYVGLADTYNLLHIYSTLPLTESYPRAIAAAKRAVQLDDSLAEAHRALAFAYFYGAGNWRDSETEFRRAIQLDPRDPVTRRWYATAFALPGRFKESLEQFDKARELDPTSHSTLSDEGITLFNSGKRDEGISLLKDVERTNPEFFSPHNYLMDIALIQRDYLTFLDEGQKAAEVRNDPVLKDIIAATRAAYTKGGEKALYRALYVKQEHYFALGQLAPGWLAKTCVALGKRQEALHLFEVSYTRHEADTLWWLTEPDLRALKDEPKYKELERKINFPTTPPL
jgi:tetratricopeptide (TPR) repeat protein